MDDGRHLTDIYTPEAPRHCRPQPVLSIIIPVFNEEAVIPLFHARLAPVLAGTGLTWEALYVDDGSQDGSLAVLEDLRLQHPEIGIVSLSRNFGKEAAMTAGLDHARGSGAVAVIDVDLQDPPEVIPQLVAVWQQDGVDVVFAQRRSRAGETWLKKATASAFYRLMARLGGPVRLPPDVGDFRLMSRRSVDALLQLRERHRFMKGLFAWVGFPSRAVPYDRAPRAAGTTKWNYGRLFNLSVEGITSFTTLPLRVATWLGVVTAVFAIGYGGQVVAKALIYGNPVPGYPSIMAVVLFLGGVQLMTLGVIGEYLGRVFNETKGRPLYIIGRHLTSAATHAPGTGHRPQTR